MGLKPKPHTDSTVRAQPLGATLAEGRLLREPSPRPPRRVAPRLGPGRGALGRGARQPHPALYARKRRSLRPEGAHPSGPFMGGSPSVARRRRSPSVGVMREVLVTLNAIVRECPPWQLLTARPSTQTLRHRGASRENLADRVSSQHGAQPYRHTAESNTWAPCLYR